MWAHRCWVVLWVLGHYKMSQSLVGAPPNFSFTGSESGFQNIFRSSHTSIHCPNSVQRRSSFFSLDGSPARRHWNLQDLFRFPLRGWHNFQISNGSFSFGLWARAHILFFDFFFVDFGNYGHDAEKKFFLLSQTGLKWREMKLVDARIEISNFRSLGARWRAILFLLSSGCNSYSFWARVFVCTHSKHVFPVSLRGSEKNVPYPERISCRRRFLTRATAKQSKERKEKNLKKNVEEIWGRKKQKEKEKEKEIFKWDSLDVREKEEASRCNKGKIKIKKDIPESSYQLCPCACLSSSYFRKKIRRNKRAYSCKFA